MLRNCYSRKLLAISIKVLLSYIFVTVALSGGVVGSGVPSGYVRYSVNTLGYQKHNFLKKLIPLKTKVQYTHSILYGISTFDCHY